MVTLLKEKVLREVITSVCTWLVSETKKEL